MTLILKGTDNSVSDPAVQGGTGGATTGVYYPASNQVGLATAGALALLVDGSQNVGIGNASPGGYKLAIGDGSSNRGRIMLKGATSGNYPEINIDDTMNSSGKNYQIYSTGGHLKVANQTDAAVSFVANAFGIGLADNAPVDGDGIRFPATQNASSNANTLDDYEEGTWTPVLKLGATTQTQTSGGPNARYTKIGNLVYFVCETYFSKSGTGDFAVEGLPFTSVATRQCVVNFYFQFYTSSMPSTYFLTYIGSSGTSFTVQYMPSGGTQTASVNDTMFTGGTNYFYFGGCYQVT